MSKIVVIGSVSTDFIIHSDKRPLVGETIIGQSYSNSFGGKGANQAITCARLGVETSFIGCVGTDIYGEKLVRNLNSNGVTTSSMVSVKDSPSGVAFITLAEGDNSIIVIPGANDKVSTNVVEQSIEEILKANLVIIQNEIPLETIQYIIEVCHKNSISILLNPAPALRLDESYIDMVTFLTPNESEFDAMFEDQLLEDVLEKYPNKLVVTLGERGAIYHSGEKLVQMTAVFTEEVVDTTGAGDTFNGTFACGICAGLTMSDSIQLANIASSMSIQKEGAQGGIPTLEQLQQHRLFNENWIPSLKR